MSLLNCSIITHTFTMYRIQMRYPTMSMICSSVSSESLKPSILNLSGRILRLSVSEVRLFPASQRSHTGCRWARSRMFFHLMRSEALLKVCARASMLRSLWSSLRSTGFLCHLSIIMVNLSSVRPEAMASSERTLQAI